MYIKKHKEKIRKERRKSPLCYIPVIKVRVNAVLDIPQAVMELRDEDYTQEEKISNAAYRLMRFRHDVKSIGKEKLTEYDNVHGSTY